MKKNKKSIYNNLSPRDFILYTTEVLKERRLRFALKILKILLNIFTPVIIGIIFYRWQLNDFLDIKLVVKDYVYQGLMEHYLRGLILFVVLPALFVAKAFEFFGLIAKDSALKKEAKFFLLSCLFFNGTFSFD